MPRASTKVDLINMANEQFEKLFDMISAMNEAEQNCDFCFDANILTQKDGGAHWQRDKNLRDVIMHLYEWHKLLIEWEKANANGQNKPFLPSAYTWKNYGEMNVEFWQRAQNTTLAQAKQLLIDSHKQVVAVINNYNDQQLFTKKYFNWTRTSSFGQYCISATVSHYDWAIKKLKVQLKALKG